MRVGARFDEADIGGWNHGGAIAAALGVKGSEGDTSSRERFHGFTIHRAIFGGVAEAVRRHAKIVTPPHAAAKDR